MSSVPEILIILVIVVIVFGVGKVGKIGSQLGKAKKEFKKGLDGESTKGEAPDGQREVIDITPSDDSDDEDYDPKPGTRREPVEDAELESGA